MRSLFRGTPGGLAAFLIIVVLVAGGLGWATRAALTLEQEQLEQIAAADHSDRLRLALWRLDSRITAILAREESRPFNHYSAIFAPAVVLDGLGNPWPSGAVVEPSPLLSADLPEWMLLHFQIDKSGWESPQVLSARLDQRLRRAALGVDLVNVTPARKRLLAEVSRELPARVLLAQARKHAGDTTILDRVLLAEKQAQQQVLTQYAGNKANPASNNAQNYREFVSRSGQMTPLGNRSGGQQRVQKDVALMNTARNGEQWLGYFGTTGKSDKTSPPVFTQSQSSTGVTAPPTKPPPVIVVPIRPSAEVIVKMSPLVGLWLTTGSRQRLLVMRLVRLEEKEVCQGIVLDGQNLCELLAEEVQDLFLGARVLPSRDPTPEQLQQTMTSLPFYLETGPAEAAEDPGWTPLRFGLSLAWAAAVMALLAVGLGGWSLLSLSERRIRFVSAVTHELRTPLTTLQLYLDMLLGGLVNEEKQKTEYLQTLHTETDRLTRLVGNVLDFSRLENHQPKLMMGPVPLASVLEQVQSAWGVRCCAGGKELIVENTCSTETILKTDTGLLQQVLGNLLDNACKYSRDADDRRLWLRARSEGGRILLEVEDRGPGIPPSEQRSIFRTFRRGKQADATTGGVGLGLALARRWAKLLGGRLALKRPAEGGACFCVELLQHKPDAQARA
jgi:signal transduction histidine kinase